MSDIFENILDAFGVENRNRTLEEKFYDDLALAPGEKYKKIENCIYWLKHELFVYTHLQEKNWIVSKSSGPSRVQVSNKELTRALLEYYFLMHYLPKFQNERGTVLNMDKFLDLCLEHPTIKKLIEKATLLV